VAGLRDVTVYPNPTPGACRLICDLSGPMDLQWDIYTVSGRRLRSLQQSYSDAGPAILAWDGRDGEGDEIANGTYLYVLRGNSEEVGYELRKTGQLVIMR
jgi:flagellar hook assembly protein FlgD